MPENGGGFEGVPSGPLGASAVGRLSRIHPCRGLRCLSADYTCAILARLTRGHQVRDNEDPLVARGGTRSSTPTLALPLSGVGSRVGVRSFHLGSTSAGSGLSSRISPLDHEDDPLDDVRDAVADALQVVGREQQIQGAGWSCAGSSTMNDSSSRNICWYRPSITSSWRAMRRAASASRSTKACSDLTQHLAADSPPCAACRSAA